MAEIIIKEKVYKLLYEKYKHLYIIIQTRAQNALDYGQKEDAVKVLQTIVEGNEDKMVGIISKADKKIIELLEYLADDSKPVR